jgi:hypothetical protein
MTQAELVQMLISKCNGLVEKNTCLKIELEEAQAVALIHKSDMRCVTIALQDAKGGLQVRKQNQGTVENLRLALQGLVLTLAPNNFVGCHTESSFEDDEIDRAVAFANKILSLTETEVSF